MPGKVVINIEGQDNVSAKLASIRKEFDTLSTSKGWQSVIQGVGMGLGLAAFHAVETGIRDVVNAIPDLIGKGEAFAETVHTIQEATGASAEQASRLAGTFTFLGINADSMTLKLGVLAKYILAHGDAMQAAGIATEDAAGKTLNMATIIDNARHVLSQYADGADKTAQAVKLFGRAGLEMIEYLNLTDRQVSMLNDEMDRLGITMDEQGVAKAKGLSREFNLFGLSVQGVANKLLNDVAPALMSTVDQLAGWVAANGQNIANFAAEVANFVLGMISALTGASFSTVTFSDKFAALGTVVSGTGNAIDTATGSTKANTTAIDNHIKSLDADLAKLKALEAEEDKKFARDMAQIGAKLGLELAAMDASEKAHRIDEQRASLADHMASAVTGGDPKQIASVAQQQADLETSIKDEARRTQIAGVQAYVDAISKGETDAVDKKKWAEAEKKNVTVLQSQIAAAQAKGDLVAVSDLTVQLQSVQTAVVKAETDARNVAREADLAKQKAQLEDLKSAASSAGSAIGGAISGGALKGGLAITAMGESAQPILAKLSTAASSTTPGVGIAGSFEAARLAGMKFGKDIKDMMANVAGIINAAVGPGGAFGMLSQTMVELDWLTHPTFTLKGILGPDLYNFVKMLNPSLPDQVPGNRAIGGPVGANNPYIVGEHGPELFIPGSSGSIVPNGGIGGGPVTFTGNIILNGGQGTEAAAREFMIHIKRELGRQGMSFSGGV
jgi:hypothetical protein